METTGSWRRVAALAAGLATVVAGCAAPDPPADVEGETGGDVHSFDIGAASETKFKVPGGPTVTLPPGTVTGDGRLTVRTSLDPPPITLPDPAGGDPLTVIRGPAWEITIDGAELVGEVVLEIPARAPPKDGAPPPVAAYSDTLDGPLTLAGSTWDADREAIVVKTTHLSWWSALSWDWLLDGARGLAEQLFGGDYVGTQPACEREDEARDGEITITSDDGERVRWCLGLDATDTHRLKITNGRRYAVSVRFPDTVTIAGTDIKHDVTRWAADSLLRFIEQAPGRSQIILGPGDTVELAPPVGSSYDVVAQPSGGAYLVTGIAYGMDTLMMVARWAAPDVNASQLVQIFETGTCLTQAVELADTSITTPDEAFQLLLDVTALGFGCLTDAWEQFYGFDGLLGSLLLSVITWLITGVQTLIAGFEALADAITDLDGYHINLTIPAPPMETLSADELAALFEPYIELNEACRGGQPTDPATDRACEARDNLLEEHFYRSTETFLSAWRNRDAETMTALTHPNYSGIYDIGYFVESAPAETVFDCRYEVETTGNAGCYIDVVDQTFDLFFDWGLDPLRGWLLSGTGPDV